MQIGSICAMWLCWKSVPEDRIWLLLSVPWLAVAFFCFQELMAIAFSQQVENRYNCCFLSVEKKKREKKYMLKTLVFVVVCLYCFVLALNSWLFNYRYLVEEIKKREGFQLLLEPEYANICFWYIPPSLRKMEDGPEFWQKLHQVAPIIKERMMKKGSMMLGYQPHRGKVNFFRQVVISPQVSREDMDFLLDEIELLAKDL